MVSRVPILKTILPRMVLSLLVRLAPQLRMWILMGLGWVWVDLMNL